MCGVRIFEEKIVLCKKGDEITGLDGTRQGFVNTDTIPLPEYRVGIQFLASLLYHYRNLLARLTVKKMT